MFVFQNVIEADKQSSVSKGELMINDQDAMEVSSVVVMISQRKKSCVDSVIVAQAAMTS